MKSPEQRIHVIIPALDEEHSLPGVLEAVAGVSKVNVLVVDNGSRDRTADVARDLGARVITEERRGYGAACLAGLSALAGEPDSEIVAFLDADGSDDPRILPALVKPIADQNADLVLASRTLVAPEPGALTMPQRFGNRLACGLIARLWGVHYTDLAPCRALTLGTIRSLDMNDMDFGWTVQMQIRAARRGLRVMEIPSRYRRRRADRSKISGTLRGSALAGATILGVIGRELLTQER